MDKQRKRRRILELGKDVLIVALACSALWLSARIHPLGRLSGLQGETGMQTDPFQSQEGARAETVRPLRLSVNQVGTGGNTVGWSVQYDTQQSDALFQQVVSLLTEALSGAGEPEEVTREQWEEALLSAPGVSFDFQGKIPMPVLVGWLSGEDTALEAVVRRVVLTAREEQVEVYYRDEETGSYYRCLCAITGQLNLTNAIGALGQQGDSGAVYAFQEEAYWLLDPDTLISQDTPEPAVYAVTNPVSGGQADLEGLMEQLGLPADNSSFYPTADGQVARVGSDTLRLYDRGVMEYQAGEGGSEYFQSGSSYREASLLESVELCRRLTAATLGSRCGEARFYLSSVRETDEGLEIVFNYCLNGSVVLLEEDAARFFIKNGRVIQFWMNFRSYTDTGKTSVVMPVPQAMAAMEAKHLEGKELLLMYTDTGGETAAASWVAVDSAPGEA